MKKYGLYQSDSANCYLSKWNNQFRLLRPVVNKSLPSTVCQNSSTAQIWLQSDACRFSKQGSCTCCDYFQGETDTDQVEAFKIALKKIQPNTDTIECFGRSGIETRSAFPDYRTDQADRGANLCVGNTYYNHK